MAERIGILLVKNPKNDTVCLMQTLWRRGLNDLGHGIKKIVSTFKHSYKQKFKKCTILTLMSFENYSHTNPSVFVNCFSLCSGVAQHSTWKRPRSHLSTTTRTTSSRFLETPKIASNQALSFNLTLAVVFQQKNVSSWAGQAFIFWSFMYHTTYKIDGIHKSNIASCNIQAYRNSPKGSILLSERHSR